MDVLENIGVFSPDVAGQLPEHLEHAEDLGNPLGSGGTDGLPTWPWIAWAEHPTRGDVYAWGLDKDMALERLRSGAKNAGGIPAYEGLLAAVKRYSEHGYADPAGPWMKWGQAVEILGRVTAGMIPRHKHKRTGFVPRTKGHWCRVSGMITAARRAKRVFDASGGVGVGQ